MVLVLKSFCWCCDIRTGSIIVGVLGAVFTLSALVASIIFADALAGARKEHFESGDEQFLLGQFWFCVVYAVFSVIEFVLHVMLIVGASIERALIVRPWVIGSVTSAIVIGTLSLIHIIVLLTFRIFEFALIALGVYIVVVAAFVYFILVVNSYRTELASRLFPQRV